MLHPTVYTIIFSALEDEEYTLTEMKNLYTQPLFYAIVAFLKKKVGINKELHFHQK
jgi:hypothetical protein